MWKCLVKFRYRIRGWWVKTLHIHSFMLSFSFCFSFHPPPALLSLFLSPSTLLSPPSLLISPSLYPFSSPFPPLSLPILSPPLPPLSTSFTPPVWVSFFPAFFSFLPFFLPYFILLSFCLSSFSLTFCPFFLPSTFLSLLSRKWSRHMLQNNTWTCLMFESQPSLFYAV